MELFSQTVIILLMHIFWRRECQYSWLSGSLFGCQSSPTVGDNSTTLNFGVLQNTTNIYNIYWTVVMTEKNSGRIVEQIPYRIYEFSDITLPYTFQNATDYTITLQTRITGVEIIKPLLSLQVLTLPWQILAA